MVAGWSYIMRLMNRNLTVELYSVCLLRALIYALALMEHAFQFIISGRFIATITRFQLFGFQKLSTRSFLSMKSLHHLWENQLPQVGSTQLGGTSPCILLIKSDSFDYLLLVQMGRIVVSMGD